jgi:hypothetical protein
MELKKAMQILDGYIPHPDSQMVDMQHLNIAIAWQTIKAAITQGCDYCKWRNTDSYKFYTFPCRECKYRAGNHHEPMFATKEQEN